jgi:hypothetical protein
MKTYLLLLLILAAVASSCSSGKQVASSGADDVYVTKTTPSAQPGQDAPSSSGVVDEQTGEVRTESSVSIPELEQYTDDAGNTYITNNYYGTGSDWYQSQLYGPSIGFGYSYPYGWGSSLYAPLYYSPAFSLSFSLGFGYGYFPWYSSYYYPYYPAWGYYNPYYGWGYPYGGYYGGYYDCWYGGYYPPYYGYYGYRGASASNSGYDGGRQFKQENGSEQTNEGRNNFGRSSTVTNLGTISEQIGRNFSNDANNIDRGNVKSNNSNGRNNSIKDFDAEERNPVKFNSPSSNDRNLSSPDRNNNTPRQNPSGEGRPRNMASITNAVPPQHTLAYSSGIKKSVNTAVANAGIPGIAGGKGTKVNPQAHVSAGQKKSQPEYLSKSVPSRESKSSNISHASPQRSSGTHSSGQRQAGNSGPSKSRR